jgi:hypoxanthine phosphoribosyltransferase
LRRAFRVAVTKTRLAARVEQMGRRISRDYAGRTLDVVIVLENAFLFAADLVREISRPVACHFVRSQVRDVKLGGHDYTEVFFSPPPTLRGRDVLVVDAVLNTGVTQDFLLKRLEEGKPRTLKMAVLFDKPASRKVNVSAAYTGFDAASKDWIGYGLSDSHGFHRNLPYVALKGSRATGRAGLGRNRKRSAGREVSK